MTVTWLSEDWIYPPLEIVDGERTIVFTEDGEATSSQAFSVDASRAWCLREFSGTSPGLPGLFAEIETKLTNNSPSGSTYTIEAARTHEINTASPSPTSDRDIGVKYVNDDSAVDMWFDFEHSSHTFPARLLGWPEGYATESHPDVVASGSPRSNFGRYTPMVRAAHNGAVHKPAPQVNQRLASSDDDPKRSYEAHVDEPRRRRTIEYDQVGATSILKARADLAGYPALDSVVSGEENNAFLEHLEEADGSQEWLIVHDNPDQALDAYNAAGDPVWEYIALEEYEDSSEIVSPVGRSPEYYRIELEYEIRSREYTQ